MSDLKVSQEEGVLGPLIDNSYASSQTKKVLEMQGKKEHFSKHHYLSPQADPIKIDHKGRAHSHVPLKLADPGQRGFSELFERQDKRRQGMKISQR